MDHALRLFMINNVNILFISPMLSSHFSHPSHSNRSLTDPQKRFVQGIKLLMDVYLSDKLDKLKDLKIIERDQIYQELVDSLSDFYYDDQGYIKINKGGIPKNLSRISNSIEKIIEKHEKAIEEHKIVVSNLRKIIDVVKYNRCPD